MIINKETFIIARDSVDYAIRLEQELAKLKELLKESIPELESYYRSRRMSDWNNGKSEKREILINKIKEALGE